MTEDQQFRTWFLTLTRYQMILVTKWNDHFSWILFPGYDSGIEEEDVMVFLFAGRWK